MKLSDFDFNLPKELIASVPLDNRSSSRLLCMGHDGKISHKNFTDITNILTKNDLLVFNDSKVMQARIYGKKDTGAKAEILVERILNDGKATAHLKTQNAKLGTNIIIGDDILITVFGRDNGLYILKIEDNKYDWLGIMEKYGHMPLPPYMEREDCEIDQQRYQTIYAKDKGSAAAPTAGLHFDDDIFKKLDNIGVNKAFVTLHVGSGTFQPVRVDNIKEHKMHSEYLEVSEKVCEQVEQTRKNGGKVIAVGTTSVRCLETASKSGKIKPYKGDTDIFIYPGYEFKSVDGLITNFHLPQSTLLMLVSAFSGKDNILNAYEQAIKEKYRFFSYGDAMFLEHVHKIAI